MKSPEWCAAKDREIAAEKTAQLSDEAAFNALSAKDKKQALADAKKRLKGGAEADGPAARHASRMHRLSLA